VHKSSRLKFVLLLVALTCGYQLARALPIDQIDPGTPSSPDQYNFSTTTSNPIATLAVAGHNPASTLGARRDIGLNVNGGTNDASLKLSGDSYLSLENDATTSAIMTLSYGVASDLNANFLTDGSNAVSINVVAVANGPNHMAFGSGVFSLSLRTNATTGTATVSIPFSTAGIYNFSFSDPGFSGLNFADIDAITLTLTTTTAGTDFRIESINTTTVVPEPAEWALFAVGAVVLGAMARGRRA
jgi:hypothetical protein